MATETNKRPYNMTADEWSAVDRAFRLIAEIKRRAKARKDGDKGLRE